MAKCSGKLILPKSQIIGLFDEMTVHTQSLETFLTSASDGKCRKRGRDKRRAKAEAADVDK